MIDHIGNATRNVALLETPGPDPKAMVCFMADLVAETEGAKAASEIERRYECVAHEGVSPEHDLMAADFALQPAALDRDVLSTLSDFAFMNPRRLSKLPETRMLMHYVERLDPAKPKDRAMALRAARIVDHVIGEGRKAQRFTEEFNKNEIVGWVSPGTLASFGLIAHADIVRRTLRLEMLAILADQADFGWSALESGIRDILRQAGLDETLWDRIRRFDRLEGGFIDPIGMIRSNDPELAEAGQTLHDRIEEGVFALMPEPLRTGPKSGPGRAALRRLLQQGGTSGVSLLIAALGRAWRRPSGSGRLQELVESYCRRCCWGR